jgi:hypothetical protein
MSISWKTMVKFHVGWPYLEASTNNEWLALALRLPTFFPMENCFLIALLLATALNLPGPSKIPA